MKIFRAFLVVFFLFFFFSNNSYFVLAQVPYGRGTLEQKNKDEAIADEKAKKDAFDNCIANNNTPSYCEKFAENAKATPPSDDNKGKGEGECRIGWEGLSVSITTCVSQAVTWIIKNTFLQIAGFLLWLTANMFSFSIKFGILEFSKLTEGLYPIWLIVRQIISLIIVFVGLYLGFLYILGREEKFEKYIPWVVIFALFVNFSYPLARGAIDVSNIVSLKIYVASFGENALNATPNSQDTAGAHIMNKLGLKGLVAAAVDDSKKTNGESTADMIKSINSISGALMAVVFVVYAAYVFFMATFILIMRTLALIFLSVASPILLVDSVLPFLGEKAKELRKIFFEQLAVGPIFMIMIALTIKFLDVFNLRANATSGSNSIQEFFTILMMLIMLHITIKVTKQVSGLVGQYATNAMGTVGGFGLGVATGGAGLLARSTIGKAATKIRDSGWVERNQNNFMGRRAYELSNSVAKSSFDLRNSNVVAKGMQKAGMSGQMFGVGMGQNFASKETYEGAKQKRLEKAEERAKRIKTRYERDVEERDTNGNVILDENGIPKLKYKKGDLIDGKDAGKSGVVARDEYFKNRGGLLQTMFLTKEHKAKLDDSYAEQKLAETIEKYKKLKTQEEKNNFIKNFEDQFSEAIKGDPKMEKPETKSLAKIMRSLSEESGKFEKEINRVLETYSKLEGNEKTKYFDRLSDDMKEEIRRRTSVPQNKTSPNFGVAGSYQNPNYTSNNGQPIKTSIPNITDKNLNVVGKINNEEAASDSNFDQNEKPGFLKTAEDKISDRTKRMAEENTPVTTSPISVDDLKNNDIAARLASARERQKRAREELQKRPQVPVNQEEHTTPSQEKEDSTNNTSSEQGVVI